MKAITAKYVGPSNVRGARIIVTDGDTRIIVDRDDASHDPYRDAVVEFCRRMNWGGTLVHGSTKACEVYVFLDNRETITLPETAEDKSALA